MLLGEALFVSREQSFAHRRRKPRLLSVLLIARLKADKHIVQVLLPANAFEVLPPQTKSWWVVHVGL
jgi:hypothetical protein